MKTAPFTLSGRIVSLEPLQPHHADALASAAANDTLLYQWSPIPQTKENAVVYINTALAWRDAETAVPFVIIRRNDSSIIGSTRFFNIERWLWPQGHPRHGRSDADACEIGYTWFTRSALRSGANTECKLMMLTHAFECWGMLRVCFHTDVRNQRSRAALERIGAKFEGILRSHRMAADYIARDSVRYSIIAAEWADVKLHLTNLLDSHSR